MDLGAKLPRLPLALYKAAAAQSTILQRTYRSKRIKIKTKEVEKKEIGEHRRMYIEKTRRVSLAWIVRLANKIAGIHSDLVKFEADELGPILRAQHQALDGPCS